jgi:excisionase family DNA binding protein
MDTGKHAITEWEAADMLGLSVGTLRAWRSKGRGPAYARFGRAVRYMRSDIGDFIGASKVAPLASEPSTSIEGRESCR